MQVNVLEAKSQLSKLVKAALEGEAAFTPEVDAEIGRMIEDDP